jgi:hypothetical protein
VTQLSKSISICPHGGPIGMKNGKKNASDYTQKQASRNRLTARRWLVQMLLLNPELIFFEQALHHDSAICWANLVVGDETKYNQSKRTSPAKRSGRFLNHRTACPARIQCSLRPDCWVCFGMAMFVVEEVALWWGTLLAHKSARCFLEFEQGKEMVENFACGFVGYWRAARCS